MMDDEAAGRLQATFGGNDKRLASVKAKYDPNNRSRTSSRRPFTEHMSTIAGPRGFC